jgi:hypothetical protein
LRYWNATGSVRAEVSHTFLERKFLREVCQLRKAPDILPFWFDSLSSVQEVYPAFELRLLVEHRVAIILASPSSGIDSMDRSFLQDNRIKSKHSGQSLFYIIPIPLDYKELELYIIIY